MANQGFSDSSRELLMRRIMQRQQGVDIDAVDRDRLKQIQDTERQFENVGQGQTFGEALLPAAGAIGAGLLAAPFTGGTSLLASALIAGGAAGVGGAAGETLRQKTTGEAKDGFDFGDILQEGGISAAFAGGASGLQGARAAKGVAAAAKAGGRAAPSTVDDFLKLGASRAEAVKAASKANRVKGVLQAEKVLSSSLDDATKFKNIKNIVSAQPTKALKGQVINQVKAPLSTLGATIDDAGRIATREADELAKGGAQFTAKGFRGKISDVAANRFGRLTGSQVKKINEIGKRPQDLIRKVMFTKKQGGLGATSYDDAIGSIDDALGAKGRGGKIAQALSQKEKALQASIKSGADDVVDLTKFYDDMATRAKTLRGGVGGDSRANAIDDLVKETKRKFGTKVSQRKALEIKRGTDEDFGQAVLNISEKGAVTDDFQKRLGHSLRGLLKSKNPKIAKLLDDQQDLILSRQILFNARAATQAGQGSVFRSISAPQAIGRAGATPAVTAKAIRAGAGGGGKLAGAAQGLGGRVVDPSLQQALLQVGPRAVTNFSMPQAPQAAAPLQEGVLGETQGFGASGGLDPSALSQGGGDLFTALQDPQVAEAFLMNSLAQGESLDDAIGNLQDILELGEVLGLSGGADQKPLSATQQQQANNANSALTDIQKIRAEISRDSGVTNKALLSFGPLAGVTNRITGAGEFEAAKRNVVDALARLRSGAAITDFEFESFSKLVPEAGDTPELIDSKLNRLESLFSSFANPAPAAESSLAEALLSNPQTQGAF